MGYNLPLEEHGPIAAYAFYYLNQPDFPGTNQTLRLAVAPVYLDAELGFRERLGPDTDLAFGLEGGGYGDTYSEVRRGNYERAESFTGHGGGASLSLYHLFNPGRQVPLNGILRLAGRFSSYEADDETSSAFELPDDRATFSVRTGLRWGGREPLLFPSLAMEISAWHEGQFRPRSGTYGFAGDRRVESASHLFWARALLAYTLPELGHQFTVAVSTGASIDADRFSAYRLGAVLPMSSEFPLTLPGYFYQELTAKRFVHVSGSYFLPLDRHHRWNITAAAAGAAVEYLSGLEQPGRWHTGVGGGILYRPPSGAWQVQAGYGYGVDAIRDGGRGAHSIGLLVQLDLERAKAAVLEPDNPCKSRSLLRLF